MSIAEQIKGIRELIVRAMPDEGSRVVVFRGVTEAVASDGGILRVNGADWKRMDSNPVVKWNHGDEVIGRIIKREIDRKDKAVDFHVEFAGPEVSEFADSRFRLVKAGFLRAASIGFVVDEHEELTDKKRESLGLPRFGWVAKRWTGHELSIVPVGADPLALKRSIEAGEIRAEDIDMQPSEKKDTTAEAHVAKREEPGTLPHETGKAKTIAIDMGHQALREALEENTREMQRTQGAFAELADELASLTRFLRSEQDAEDQGAEIEEAQRADSSDAEANDGTEELLRQIEAIRQRVAKSEGERNEQGNHRGD